MTVRQDQGLNSRDRDLIRPGRVVLDPLTQVRIRMLMPVLVRGREFMMDPQRSGKGGQGQENQDNSQRYRGNGSSFGGSS